MKHIFQHKKIKFLLKLLAFPALFGTIAATSYGLFSTNTNTNKNLISQQNKLINQNTNVGNQPTINDVVNGDVSSPSKPTKTNDGNFILPTLNDNNVPGLIKLNLFISGLYGINFDNFTGYHVRQIVQNYNNPNQYFVLLVNDEANVTATWPTSVRSFAPNTIFPNINFSISNPGHVLSVIDTGKNFDVTADYQLDVPILDNALMLYYQNMYFQAPLASTQTQSYNWNNWQKPWYNLNPNYLSFTETDQTGSSVGNGNYFYTTKTIRPNSGLRHLNQIWNGYSKNIATLLYLNSLNNMVFVSDKVNDSGLDAIYIFGGNQYINLWFYTFYVNNQPPTNKAFIEYATGYASYGFHWGPVNAWTSPSTSSSDIFTQKAYNFKLKTDDTNNAVTSSWSIKRYTTASFFGYYVAGAKLVNNPTRQILLTLTTPNFTLANSDTAIVFSTNASYISWNAYQQNPASFYSTYYGSMSISRAIETTGYRQTQANSYAYTSNPKTWKSSESWVPGYRNYDYSFMNYLSNNVGQIDYAVTPQANDGMASRAYNEFAAYLPEDINDENIALSYSRDKMQATITTRDGVKSSSANLSLYKSDTRLNSLKNISYADQTWFLWFDDTKTLKSSKDLIYFFTYDDTVDQVFFSQTNLSLGDDTEILNILPLNKNYIYVLSRKSFGSSAGPRKNNFKVVPLLYKLSDIKGNYNQNLAYNNLVANNEVAKVGGVPAYSNNGVQNKDQKAVWGTVNFQDFEYLTKAGFLANPASFLASDPNALKTLVSYQPGWQGQDFKVNATVNANNELQISVSIKYFNGQYFTPQQLSSQSALTQTYSGFSALPSWVLPVSIGVPIAVLAIILAIGLGIGIPVSKNKKLQVQGFNKSNLKIEKLNLAVDMIYKKNNKTLNQPELPNKSQETN